MRTPRRFTWLMGVALLGAACGKPTGTYVLLGFSGVVADSKPIARIAVDLQFVGGPATTTAFELPGGTAIRLPTNAVLDVRSGAGALAVAARALAQDGTVLGIGTGAGTVVRDQTVPIDVVFGTALPDAGADVQSPVEAALPLPDGPANPGPDGGVDLPSSPDVAVGPLDVGTDKGGAGGDSDAPLGGAGGVSTGGAGGTIGAGGAIGPGGAGGSNPTYLLTATPPAADFGSVAVGSVSPPATLTIGNTGQATTPPLVIFVGDGEHFAVAAAGCDGVSLAPGRTCLVSFTFKPTAAGLVRTDAAVGPTGGVPVKVGLAGNGTVGGPQLALSPSTVDFKIVDVGISSAVGFTVTNLAATSLGGFTVTTVGASAFSIADNGCAGVTLAPQGRCGFTVAFAPTTAGSAAGAVNVVVGTITVASAPVAGVGRDQVPLTILFAGTGGGAVTAANQACASPGPCTIELPSTDPNVPPKLDLVAQPDPLSTFVGWAGDCTGSGACTVVMDAPHTVTAKLEARKVTLNLEVVGLAGHQGTVVSSDGLISCSGACPGLVHPATNSLTLSVKPAGSSTFVGWGGGPCKGTAPSCTFALTDTTSVTATFGPQSYMFVTSSTVVPGNLGGIAGADAECKRLASAARLPGTYRAWLSTKGSDAKTRVGQGGWVRTDGRPFTRSLSRLIETNSPTVYYPPRVDENGNDLGNKSIPVATGGLGDGTALDAQCADYTQPSGSLYVGDAAAGFYWAYRQLEGNGCGSAHRLYCFRSDSVATDIVPPAQPGRRVFVSSQPFVPGTTGNPDVLCQKDADAAGLPNPGNYIALIATTTTPAIRRLTSTGQPWKRADEVVVARQSADFAAGTLLAPIDLTADGTQYVAAYVWTGAADPAAQGSATCGDWQGSTPAGQGQVGDNQTTASPDWFAYMKIACANSTTRLLCIEP